MTLPATDFAYVTQLVRQRSAIDLQPGKEYLVESRLAPIARTVGERDVSGVVARLRRGDSRLTELVVDALTTNETSWFRDTYPFQAITQHLLPGLLASGRRSLTFWSAACSSGQEAYSLAMLLLEWLPAHPGVSAQIIGTDISPRMVERARSARYSQLEVNRGMPATSLVKHFTRDGASWRIAPAIASAVTFRQLNLVRPFPPIGRFDVVFLRNVLIYFDLPTKRDILRRVRQVLAPDGFLFLGAAEMTMGVDDQWERVPAGRSSVYQIRKDNR